MNNKNKENIPLGEFKLMQLKYVMEGTNMS